jgi:acyl carrier protein
MDDLMPRLKALLAEILGDDAMASAIDDQADMVNDLGLDSIQMITFLLSVEDEFDVNLDFENLDLSDLTSLSRFHAFVLAMRQPAS